MKKLSHPEIGMSKQDNYGFLGPEYSYADDIKLPGQIGVRQEPSFGAILDSVGGVNYYIDQIAFGGPTGFDKQNVTPLGVRYFLNTEMTCSNGASMSEYFDGVTKGDLLGKRVKDGLESAGLPGLRGLAPGMLENARDALDPRPIFDAIAGGGYPVCQQVKCPVGTEAGNVSNPDTPDKPYILGELTWEGGIPYQTRWVKGYDEKGNAVNLSREEFAAMPKCYNADGTYMARPSGGCPAAEPPAKPTRGKGKYERCTQLKGTSREGFTEEQKKTIETSLTLAASIVLVGALVFLRVR
jgi:hypothetical protein